MAEKVTFQQLDRINPIDTEGLASRTIQRKFGKSNFLSLTPKESYQYLKE